MEFIRIDPRSIPPDMELTFPGGKLHGVTVTEAQINYIGSLTLDADIMEEAGLLPLEFVHIWSKTAPARLSTYLLPGTRGSGLCCANGGAAQFFQVGDEAIVTSERRITLANLVSFKTKILTFHHGPKEGRQGYNRIAEIMSYELEKTEAGFSFKLTTLEKRPL